MYAGFSGVEPWSSGGVRLPLGWELCFFELRRNQGDKSRDFLFQNGSFKEPAQKLVFKYGTVLQNPVFLFQRESKRHSEAPCSVPCFMRRSARLPNQDIKQEPEIGASTANDRTAKAPCRSSGPYPMDTTPCNPRPSSNLQPLTHLQPRPVNLVIILEFKGPAFLTLAAAKCCEALISRPSSKPIHRRAANPQVPQRRQSRRT